LLREPLGLPLLPVANWPTVFLPFFIRYNITYYAIFKRRTIWRLAT